MNQEFKIIPRAGDETGNSGYFVKLENHTLGFFNSISQAREFITFEKFKKEIVENPPKEEELPF